MFAGLLKNGTRERTIWVHDIHREAKSLVIADRTFEDVIIEGPAMLMLSGDINIWDARFPDGPPTVAELDPVPKLVTGAILFRDCSFIRCTFRGIGFIGRLGLKQQIMAGLKPKTTYTPERNRQNRQEPRP